MEIAGDAFLDAAIIAGQWRRRAFAFGGAVDDGAVGFTADHSSKWKRAAGDILGELLKAVVGCGFNTNGIIDRKSGVFPQLNADDGILVDLVLIQQQFKHFFRPYLVRQVFPDVGYVHEAVH